MLRIWDNSTNGIKATMPIWDQALLVITEDFFLRKQLRIWRNVIRAKAWRTSTSSVESVSLILTGEARPSLRTITNFLY